jgi:hypothetical protein
MATTNVIKWDDTNNRLTAFCLDDTGETEIGPCKWDDTNNRLEINCNSVDATVKWDDTGNNLESRTTDDGCCEETCDLCCSSDSYGEAGTCPQYITLVMGVSYVLEIGQPLGSGGWFAGDGDDNQFIGFFEYLGNCYAQITIVSGGEIVYDGEVVLTIECAWKPVDGCDGDNGYLDTFGGCDQSVSWYPSDSLGNPI